MAIDVHIKIEDCLQDCPFGRIRGDKITCGQMDPEMVIGEFKLPLPFITPHKRCPWLAMEGVTQTSKGRFEK